MSSKLIFLLFGGPVVALLAFATIYKYFEILIVRRWPSVRGRVVLSKVISRKVGGVGGDQKDEELRNFAEVVYEYAVQGRTHRASRVSIGENPGNFQVEETLARYPEGTEVMVHYNPTRPGEAVLEREPPPGIFKVMTFLILGIIAFGLAAIFGIERLTAWLSGVLPAGGNATLAVVLGLTGVFTMLLAFAAFRSAKATENWRSTWGKIESSGVEEFDTLDKGRWRKMKRASIVYGYTVNGNRYRGSRVAAEGWRTSSNLGFLVKGKTAKYPAGQPVEVFYDPENPAKAALERRVAGGSFIYLIALALLAGAAKAAGLF